MVSDLLSFETAVLPPPDAGIGNQLSNLLRTHLELGNKILSSMFFKISSALSPTRRRCEAGCSSES